MSMTMGPPPEGSTMRYSAIMSVDLPQPVRPATPHLYSHPWLSLSMQYMIYVQNVSNALQDCIRVLDLVTNLEIGQSFSGQWSQQIAPRRTFSRMQMLVTTCHLLECLKAPMRGHATIWRLQQSRVINRDCNTSAEHTLHLIGTHGAVHRNHGLFTIMFGQDFHQDLGKCSGQAQGLTFSCGRIQKVSPLSTGGQARPVPLRPAAGHRSALHVGQLSGWPLVLYH